MHPAGKLFAVALAAGLAGGACENRAKKRAPAEEPTPPGPAAPAEPTAEVRPPTAADLATFTADLEGSGPLMAVIATSMGTFHCELFEEKAPLTVANFVGLATGKLAWRDPRDGKVKVNTPLYDGLLFHRVIPGFMIQGGDPLGRGSGGPGYQFADEFDPSLRHDKPGIMSMANSGKNSNGSQFFITEGPTKHLDDGHSVFGHCAEGDLVAKMTRVDRGPNDRPLEPIVIEKVTIQRGK